MRNLLAKTYFLLATCTLSVSCIDLDIPPLNIITENQVFDNESGIDAYFANIYNYIPMMDRQYSIKNGYNNAYVIENMSTLTGEAVGRDQSSTVINDYWNYGIIRKINMFIETLPQYAAYHSEENIKHWLGEAHFLRAFVYSEMVKRYGGMPLVTKVLNYPEEDIETFKIPRSSEEDTWLQIEKDFQYAIDNCKEKSVKGRANRYTAAAYKSSAMIFAASIANFNEISHHDTERGYRLCGIDKDKAAYFYKSAWNAAKLVEGHYSLYMDEWKEGDKEAQYENFQKVLQKPDNCESIFVKEYRYPEITHSWDALYGPLQLKQDGLSGGVSPTLEFVELFEGIKKDANGLFSPMNDDGTYIMYDDIMDPYKDAEPRLRATVIFPGDIFKGEEIEIWRGVYKKPIPNGGLKKIVDRNIYNNYINVNKNIGNALLLSTNPTNNTIYTRKDGTNMYCSGASGSYNSFIQGSFTGFLLRKNLDTSLPKESVRQNMSESDWVDMRYAEVLLNRTEAAYELQQLGEQLPDNSGKSCLKDALECINLIRKRAGCINMYDESTINRNEIRDEFFRELAFENKTYWNLVRWRIYHIRHDSKVRYHAAMPFYAGEIDKWFYDIKYNESAKNFTFNPINYYKAIPAGQISSNPNLIQNPR